VPGLVETQSRLRDAIVNHDGLRVTPLLTGGANPARRLAIHLRHYEASLVNALLGKFPACVWLLGGPFLTAAAREFVHCRPPTAPCIAEYGAELPAMLASRLGAERTPYLESFARLEWLLGQVAVAVDRTPLAMGALSQLPADGLPDLVLTLQPGLGYLQASWPVDDLMKLYLSEAQPDRYVFDPAEVGIEIRGARGEVRIDRLDRASYLFRNSLRQRLTIGAAAEIALAAEPAFDAGRALAKLFSDALVTDIQPATGEAAP
jgi:hypothetical protein